MSLGCLCISDQDHEIHQVADHTLHIGGFVYDKCSTGTLISGGISFMWLFIWVQTGQQHSQLTQTLFTDVQK